ncbi:hypothetical protein QM312_36745, partial [Burkholderia cenocepacia]|uniref:hypothetical protein n=1 Tax=Burkholderia cenocepacia TaxID=95486 RepID=UPI0024B7BBAA
APALPRIAVLATGGTIAGADEGDAVFGVFMAASHYNRGHEYTEHRIPFVRAGAAAHRRPRHRRHHRRR